MVHPVSSGILGEGKVTNGISVDFVIESEEDTEASMCQKGMCRFGENVVVRKVFVCRRKAFGCQEFLD
jgi:hypothetical protein